MTTSGSVASTTATTATAVDVTTATTAATAARSPRRVFAIDGLQPLFDRAGTQRVEAARASAAPAHALMRRAGLATARLALALAPHVSRIGVVAGPGNNGGDGFEAARSLHAWGKSVTVWFVGNEAALPADAAAALQRARQAGVEIVSGADIDTTPTGDADGWIDALLGIGASREPSGTMARLVAHLNAQRARGARVLSIDVPSGLDVDTGQPFGATVVTADHTLAMLTLKPGLFTAEGRDHAGDVWLVTLQADDDLPNESTSPVAWLSGTGTRSSEAPRRHAQHKGSFGDVAIVGGAPGMLGAALLAARAALAAGAGRVYVNALDPSFDVDTTRPELMARHDWWQSASNDTLAATTVVCGCGGGDPVRTALPRLLSLAGRLVLDADALNAIARDTGLQAALAARSGRRRETVVTPHPLEAARLLGIDTRVLQGDRLAAAARLAERYRCVVVLKGSGTVVAAPGETARINASGNASLASAGTGDVLAGWIGGRWSSQGERPEVESADAPSSIIDLVMEAVAEHGHAAEPLRPGAIRAGDLIEALHARARAALNAGRAACRPRDRRAPCAHRSSPAPSH